MAARPNPSSAIRMCVQLAKNSVRRLDAATESAETAIDNNARLTPAEQEHYVATTAQARRMRKLFAQIAGEIVALPPRSRTGRKIGRPSKYDVQAWAAQHVHKKPAK
jgi:hypothetical protein